MLREHEVIMSSSWNSFTQYSRSCLLFVQPNADNIVQFGTPTDERT